MQETHYVFQWDAFQRLWPEVVERARRLSPEEAACILIGRYLKLVGAATPEEIAWLFTLNLDFLRYVAPRFAQRGDFHLIEEAGRSYLVTPDASG